MLNKIQLLTAVALALFIVFRLKVPSAWLPMVSGMSGKAVLGVLVIYLFYEHVILGILGAIAVYEIISQVEPKVLSTVEEPSLPNDESMLLSSFQQFPPTLEEDIVNNLVPLIPNQSPPHLNFKSSPEDIHNAASI